MAEGAPLLREYGLTAHRGFESLSLRQISQHKGPLFVPLSCLMSTTTEKEIDYQAYLRESPPDLSNVVRGPEAREKRWKAALKWILQDKQSEDHDRQ